MRTSASTAIICLADHTSPRLQVAVYCGHAGSILVVGAARWCRYCPALFVAVGDGSCESVDITHDVLAGWHAAPPAVAGFFLRSPLVVRRGWGFSAVHPVAMDAPPCRVPPGTDHQLALRPAAACGDWTVSGHTS